MTRPISLFISAAALLLGLSAAQAGQLAGSRPLPRQPLEKPPSSAALATTLKQLTSTIDLWHDAVLKGNDDDRRHFEGALQDLMQEDLASSKRGLRFYARQSALAVPRTKPLTHTDKDKVERSDEFKRELAVFNSKEHLWRSFTRTNAFSNKYRLISDYIDVLRRQLNMPRIQLANKNNSTPQRLSGDVPHK